MSSEISVNSCGDCSAVCKSLPNYCDYPCANFFAFNERIQRYFQDHPKRLDCYEGVPKKFIVISNTEKHNFRAVLQQHSAQEPEIHFSVHKNMGKEVFQVLSRICAGKMRHG